MLRDARAYTRPFDSGSIGEALSTNELDSSAPAKARLKIIRGHELRIRVRGVARHPPLLSLGDEEQSWEPRPEGFGLVSSSQLMRFFYCVVNRLWPSQGRFLKNSKLAFESFKTFEKKLTCT